MNSGEMKAGQDKWLSLLLLSFLLLFLLLSINCVLWLSSPINWRHHEIKFNFDFLADSKLLFNYIKLHISLCTTAWWCSPSAVVVAAIVVVAVVVVCVSFYFVDCYCFNVWFGWLLW